MEIRVKVGDTFAVPLIATVGGPLAAAALFGSFDPAVMQVGTVEAGLALANTLIAAADNAAGTFDFAALNTAGPVDGAQALTLATLQMVATAVTPGSPLVYSYEGRRKTQGAYHGIALEIGQSDVVVVIEEAITPPVPLAFDVLGASLFVDAFGATPEMPNWNGAADLNADGIVDTLDFELFKAAFIAALAG
jgi:hypothetical protein